MDMFNYAFFKTRMPLVRALLPKQTPRRMANVARSYMSYLTKSDTSGAIPPIIIAYVTFDCNYRCIMCQKSVPGSPTYDNTDSIEFEALDEIITNHGRDIGLFRLHGGEPLKYYEIDRLLDRLVDRSVPYTIITNCSMLKEDVSRRLVGSCVGLTFSIDAVTPDIYKKMRRGGRIEKVTANIEALNKVKRERRSYSPVLNIASVFFGFNIQEMPKLVEYCHTNGIKSMSATEGWDYDSPFIAKEDLIPNHIEATRRYIQEAKELADRYDIIFRARFPSLNKAAASQAKSGGPKKIQTCSNLYISADLHANMDVIACCSARTNFGNLKENTLAEIWNGSDYREARNMLANGKVPAACKGCPSLFG